MVIGLFNESYPPVMDGVQMNAGHLSAALKKDLSMTGKQEKTESCVLSCILFLSSHHMERDLSPGKQSISFTLLILT